MTRSEKIRDAILGISKEEIEKTEGSSRPVRLEDGKTLTEKKWRNMSDWAGCRQGEVVVYVDDTVLGNCKKGAVFTEEVFWNKEALAVSKENRKYFNPLRYAEIRGITWSAKKSSTFVIQFEDAAVEVNGSIYAKFYAEALKRAAAAAGYTWAKENKAVPKKESAEKKVVNKSDVRPDPLADLNSLDYSGKSGSLVEQVARRAQERRIAEREQAEKMDGTPAPVPVGQLTLADVNARIAAIERELNELYARKAELEAEEAAALKAAEEATAKKAAEEAAARKAAEEAAEIDEDEEEDEDLFEENENFEIAQEAVLDGDIEKAIRYYERAAAEGDCSAMCELGNLYGDDLEMERDAEKAFYWYDQADRHGDLAGAVFAAGLAIEIARTFENLETAEDWIGRAEEKGQHKNAQNLREKLLRKQREIEKQPDVEDPAAQAAEEAAARKAAEEAAARRAVEEAAARKAAEEAAARKAAEEAAARKVAEEAAARKAAEEAVARKAAEEAAARKAAEEAAAKKAAEEAAAMKKQEDERAAEIEALLESIREERAAHKAAEKKTKTKTNKKPQGKPLTEKTFEELTAYEVTQLIRTGEHKHITRQGTFEGLSAYDEINYLEKEIILEFDDPIGGTGALLEEILVRERKMDADFGTFYGMGGYLGRKYEELKAEGPTDHARTQIDRCVTVLNYILLSLKNSDRHKVYIWVTTREQREAVANRWNENPWNSWKKKLIRYYTEVRDRFIRLYR